MGVTEGPIILFCCVWTAMMIMTCPLKTTDRGCNLLVRTKLRRQFKGTCSLCILQTAERWVVVYVVAPCAFGVQSLLFTIPAENKKL